MERCGLRQATKTAAIQPAMTLREILGVGDRAPRRHGQDRSRRLDECANCCSVARAMPAQPNE